MIFILENNYVITNIVVLVYPICYGSLINSILLIILLGYQLLQYPRPTKAFWNFFLILIISIITIKYIFQFKILELSNRWFMFIGLERYVSAKERLSYFIGEAIILYTIISERNNLMSKGLWLRRETEVESYYQSIKRISMFKYNEIEDITYNKLFLSVNKSINNNSIVSSDSYLNDKTYLALSKTNLTFQEEYFPNYINLKTGKDYYVYCMYIQIIILFYLLFFFDNLLPDDYVSTYNVNNIKLKQLNGIMVCCFIIMIIIIIIDTVLSNRKYILKGSEKECNLYFDNNGVDISKSYSEDKRPLMEDEMLIKNNWFSLKYNVIYVIYESQNYKFVVHIVLLISVHLMLFVYLPLMGNYNINGSYICQSKEKCNYYFLNGYLKFLYFLFGLYFYFSANQIRFGFPYVKKRPFLKSWESSITIKLYSLLKSIPFLYELKVNLEYFLTTTNLSKDRWNISNNLYDVLFISKIKLKQRLKKKPGEIQSNLDKILNGMIPFITIILLIIIPLYLYSDINLVKYENNVKGVVLSMELCFNADNLVSRFPLYETKNVESISPMSQNYFDANKYNESGLTNHYPIEQVQVVSLYKYSDTYWSITEPKIKIIKKKFENYKKIPYEIYLLLKYSFERKTTNSDFHPEMALNYTFYSKNDDINLEFFDNFKSNIINCTKKDLITDNIFYSVSTN